MNLQVKALLSGGVMHTIDARDVCMRNFDHKLYNKYPHLLDITK